MRYALGISLLLMAVLWPVPLARALETDQFTVPPAPLVDLSPQFQQHVLAVLQEVVVEANSRHARFLRESVHARSAASRGLAERKAGECLSPDFIAHLLYDSQGHGLPECTIEKWARSAKFPDQPAKFEISPDDSIYGSLIERPLTIEDLSPTINLYNVYFGTDKVGHLFQQGYEYYELFREAERAGKSEAAAYQNAVALGVSQENGFFGLAMTGVYANGDLAANYAGLKFYLNLTRALTMNGREYPPILSLRGDRWEINPEAGPDFMKLFITEHLSEAMNPSFIASRYRETVRSKLRERGPRWLEFYHSTPAIEAQRVIDLGTWFGEDYGHSGFERLVTIANTVRPTYAEQMPGRN